MIVESHSNLGKLQRADVTRLVVYDRHGNPVIAAMEIDQDKIWVSRRGEPRFEQALKNMGIKDTIIRVQTLGEEDLSSPQGRLLLPDEPLPQR
jgi:hypothetical protein